MHRNMRCPLQGSLFPRDFEVGRKRFARDLYKRDVCRARANDLSYQEARQGSPSISFSSVRKFLAAFSCYSFPAEARETCVNSRAPRTVDRAHENRTVDSAAFHKERLFRCVDGITFLHGGGRYTVNIRADVRALFRRNSPRESSLRRNTRV